MRKIYAKYIYREIGISQLEHYDIIVGTNPLSSVKWSLNRITLNFVIDLSNVLCFTTGRHNEVI